MRDYDMTSVLSDQFGAGVVRLSSDTRALIMQALQYTADIWRWTGGDDIDAIEALSAKASYEVQVNIMIGSVVWIAGAVPDYALECDGSTYARADYPAVYEVLDPVYILDTDFFRVPDLRGRFIRGASLAEDVGATGGEATHTLTEAEMPIHTHTYIPPTINIDVEAPGVPDPVAAGIGLPTSTGSAGGGQSHNNLPPYEVLLPCLIVA